MCRASLDKAQESKYPVDVYAAAKLSRSLLWDLIVVMPLLLTACGTGFNQQSSVQSGPSQPGTPVTPSVPPTPPPNPNPTPAPSGPEYFYFGFSGNIYGYELHDDGSLTKTPNSPYSLGGDTQYTSGLTLNPQGTLGFAATGQACFATTCEGTNSVSVFSVSAATGELNLLCLDTSVGSVANDAFDDTGRYLYQSTNQGIRAFSVTGQGYLSELSGSPFPSIYGFIQDDPASDQFFIVGTPPGQWLTPFVSSFVPSAEDGIPVAAHGPVGFKSQSLLATVIDSQGRYLLVMDGVQAKENLHVFSIGSGISEIDGSPFTVDSGGLPTAIALDPTSKWFYLASSVSGIAQYSFDIETGRIGERRAFTPVYNVSTLRFDRTGKFLLATDLPTIYVYRVDPVSGSLQLATKSSLLQ